MNTGQSRLWVDFQYHTFIVLKDVHASWLSADLQHNLIHSDLLNWTT
jgi:hypothetical protein